LRPLPLAAAITLLAALSGVVIWQTRLERDLTELPTPERQALYERTRETLRSSCLQARDPDVAEHCRQEAEFITRFPECNAECRELAAHFAHRPSR
jgi:cytochrome b pre-mRNA-processing protein 3